MFTKHRWEVFLVYNGTPSTTTPRPLRRGLPCANTLPFVSLTRPPRYPHRGHSPAVAKPVPPQAFLQKSLDSQKNLLDLKKITRFKVSTLKLTVLLEIIYLCTSLPKNLNAICKFAEGWIS